MHPEVTSTKEGEKCPKCGMALVHNDQVSNGKTCQMQFVPTPMQMVAGQPVTLTYTPQEVGNEKAPVPLAVVHEKKIHLIIVRKDLSAFYHEHPEYTAEGNYRVPFTFAKGGDYVLFQDYTPDGSGHQHGRQPVTVQGPKFGQVVVISEDTECYLHVHPNDQADKGPAIGFNTNFEAPGLYRVFLQFNHAGTIHTGNFTITVKA